MSDTNVRAKLIQQVRRAILNVLLTAYPHALEGESIFELLLEQFPDLMEQDVERDLAYLREADKGYVELEGDGRRLSWEQRRYTLTGKGNELANRLDHDPALGI